MNKETILALVDSIPVIMTYVLPGYLFIQIRNFMLGTHKKGKDYNMHRAADTILTPFGR